MWLLTKRVRSRIFQGKTIPEILAVVFDGIRVADEILPQMPAPDGSGKMVFYPRDYCSQYRESDFAFASRLMEEEGIYYYFRPTAEGEEMVLSNTPQKHDPLPEPVTLIFDDAAGGRRDEGRVVVWNKVQEVRAGLVSLRDHCFEMPDNPFAADQKIQEGVAAGAVTHKLNLPPSDKLELYDYPGRYASRFDGIDPNGAEQPAELDKIAEDNRRTARLRVQEEASGAVSVDGESDCRHLAAGHKFTLDRHFDADGDYVLTHVRHRAGLTGGYRSGGGDLGLDYHNAFRCVPFELPFRPPRSPRARP